jgi:2OG-Fe(II) oxygenase superfamily
MHYQRLEQLFFRVDSGETARLQIGKFTLERVHASPNIYIIENFLSTAELQYLHHIAESTNRFQRSYVDAVPSESSPTGADNGALDSRKTTSHYDTSHRTSTFVSFAPHQDAKCAGIETKAAELLGCWSSANGVIEPLQLVRYRKGQFFGAHHDLGDYNAETHSVDLPPKSIFAKRRIVTLFCYLNSVPEGGATHFPSLTTGNGSCELRIEPVPGRAVLFANITGDGQPDPRTIHAGEPVETGIKYGLNIWVCEE